MRPIELRLPQEFDKSFVFFNEKGTFFPCPLHYHPEYELVLVLESTGRRYVGDNVSEFGPEDLVFMGSMLPHVWVNDPSFIDGNMDGRADALVIHFKESFLGEQFFDAPELAPIKKVLNLSKRGLAMKGNTRKKINSIMKEMVSESGIQRLSSLLLIFDELSSTTEYKILASPGYANLDNLDDLSRLDEVVKYLKMNFDQDISLKEMASLASMGVTTFCNLFKKNYRTTFTDFLIKIRIGNATKLLLEENDENIAGIAFTCGYNSLANFNRQFKKLKGMTPSEFKDKFFHGNDQLNERFISAGKTVERYLAS